MIKITGRGDQGLLFRYMSGLLLALLASCILVLAASPSRIAIAAPSPPAPTTARYMKTVDPTTLYKLGCRQSSESGVIILDFGQPWYQNSTYGVLYYSSSYPFASTTQIATAAESFLQGHSDCLRSGSTILAHVTLGIGLNNYHGATTYNHGKAWASMVDQVNGWIVSKGYNTYEAAAGANDIEMSWNSAANTRAWADGYASDPNHPSYYDFGDAGGCPPSGSCNNGWTQADVTYVSWDVQQAFPLPQIYYSSQASEWYQLALYSHNHPGPKGPMRIQGVLTQYAEDRTTNTPSQGWTELWNSLNADARTAQTPLYSSDITKSNDPGIINPPQSPFNPRYVTNLYHDILGRMGSPSDVNWWVQALNKGSSRSQVASSFLASTEYRTLLVAADYQQILHRSADSGGSAFYVGQLNNGAKNEDVLVGLAASDDYFANRGGGTNSGFVNALYQDLLQRSADPAGLNFWMQRLNAGTATRGNVARGLVTSTERSTNLVDGYFLHYLGRTADPSGENYYVSLLAQGGTDENVIGGLVSSDEYYAKPSWFSVRYVTNLYHDIMNRTASQVDVNWWAQALDHGSSRGQVANSFLASSEYRTNLVVADYQQILHRAADSGGSAFYVGQLNNGTKNEDVLVGLAASDDYFANRGGSTNNGFVSALYQDLLQRAADPSGLAYWTQQLNNGVSRATVAQGLVTSIEYRTKLVDGYYLHYLGRNADPSGESYFISILNNGGTDESVIVGLVASDEYYAKQQAS